MSKSWVDMSDEEWEEEKKRVRKIIDKHFNKKGKEEEA